MGFNKKFLKENIKFILLILFLIIIFILFSNKITNNNYLDEKELQNSGNNNINSLIINEVMPSNDGAYASDNGEIYDWIEIYNGSDNDINLFNYALSDDSGKPKWSFPEVTIKSKAYLVIYLSGEKKEGLYASFKLSSNGDEDIFLLNPNNKTVDAVDIPSINKNETIARDLDGAWFISKEITPGYSNTKEGYNEYLNSLKTDESNIKINEILPENEGNFLNSYNNYSGYIEIINEGNEEINLKDYCISNSYKSPFKKKLKEILLKPQETAVIYMGDYEDNNEEIYSGFNLDNKTGTVILTNNKGKIIDLIEYENIPNGIAYIKENGTFYKSGNISPGYENNINGITKFSEIKLKNKNDLIINEIMNNNSSYLAQNGNEYYDWIEIKNNSNHDINLNEYYLSNNDNNYELYNLPNKILKPNEIYIIMASGDLNLTNNSYSHLNFKLSEIESLYLTKNNQIIDSMLISDVPLGYSMGRNNTNGFYYFNKPTPGKANESGIHAVAYIPSFSIEPGVYNNVENINLEINGTGTIYYTLDGSNPTLKSNVYKGPLLLSSTTVVKAISYADGKINSSVITGSYIINENHTLPVMSVSLNPSNFNYVQSNIWNTEIEVAAYAELYEEDDNFSIPCGFKLFGGSVRGMNKKSFALKFKKQYGASTLNYQVFDNRDFSKFNTLILRSGSQDSNLSFMRDILMTSLVDGVTNLEVQAYKSVVLYINGKYWGVYNIREKVDDDFISNHFNVDGSLSNIVRIDKVVSKGTIKDYQNVLNYLNNNNMSISSNYEYIKTKLNIESFADYWAAQAFVTNNDIINTRFYSNPNIDNGRLNMIFYDLDYAMYHIRHDYFTFAVQPGGMSDFKISTEMMRSLLNNKEFRNTFLERIGYQYKNVWNEERILNRIDEIYNNLKPEMERNQLRWGMTMQNWETNVEKLREYAKKRGYYYKLSAKNFFNLSNSEMEKYFGD